MTTQAPKPVEIVPEAERRLAKEQWRALESARRKIKREINTSGLRSSVTDMGGPGVRS